MFLGVKIKRYDSSFSGGFFDLRIKTAFLGKRVMFKNRRIMGRRSTWGLTACFVQTQQKKALTGESLRSSRNAREYENSGEAQHLGRRSFLGGSSKLGTHAFNMLTQYLLGDTHLGTDAKRGAAVPPS